MPPLRCRPADDVPKTQSQSLELDLSLHDFYIPSLQLTFIITLFCFIAKNPATLHVGWFFEGAKIASIVCSP
jgi:hypothetical protein